MSQRSIMHTLRSIHFKDARLGCWHCPFLIRDKVVLSYLLVDEADQRLVSADLAGNFNTYETVCLGLNLSLVLF